MYSTNYVLSLIILTNIVILSEAAVRMLAIRKRLRSAADAKDLSAGRLMSRRGLRFFAYVADASDGEKSTGGD